MRRVILLSLVTLAIACDSPFATDPVAESVALNAAVRPVERPFRGAIFIETVDFVLTPCDAAPEFCAARCGVPESLVPLWVIAFTSEGHATHLGRFEMFAEHCSAMRLTDGAVLYGDGVGVLTAANGDELEGTYASYGMDGDGIDGITGPVPDEPGTLFFKDTYVFTGGTGRFSRASGSVTDYGKFMLSPSGPVIIEWTMEGSIIYAASDRRNR
ncbi:MAG: hypothetical protein KAJ43_09940 [Gemmatimonadetes bacterium]|nr:hypothetical protein [Gemmatimonadota bacterium]